MKNKPLKSTENHFDGVTDPSLEEVLQIIQFMGESHLAEIDLETPTLKLSLRKNASPGPAMISGESPSLLPPVKADGSPEPSVLPRKIERSAPVIPQRHLHKIVSPMAGTFYRAPSATSAPYVNEGDQVTTGMPVCIVEAMKLMNEIKADKTGKIVKIHIANAKAVEKGTLLFEIDPEPQA